MVLHQAVLDARQKAVAKSLDEDIQKSAGSEWKNLCNKIKKIERN